MPEIETLIVAAIFIGVFVTILAISSYLEKKRTAALKQASRKLGFNFLKDYSGTLPEGNLFSKGHSKKARNIISGRKDRIMFKLYDYKYTVGVGRNSHTYSQTVIECTLEKTLPDFILSEESVRHKFVEKIGFSNLIKDIDFTENKLFSDKFLLKGSNENEVRSLFNIDIQKRLESLDPKFVLDAKNNTLLYYQPNKKVKPQEIRTFLDKATTIIRLFTD